MECKGSDCDKTVQIIERRKRWREGRPGKGGKGGSGGVRGRRDAVNGRKGDDQALIQPGIESGRE